MCFMKYVHAVEPGESVSLRDLDPGDTGSIDRKHAEEIAGKLEDTLDTLQESLYAADQNSVLVVLQGLDTAGKDGTVSHVMAHFNPSGCRVESFKVPTALELAHDFLWRAHAVTPARGTLSIFNRSYYEDVLAVRVHKLVPRSQWEKRYEQINHFESLLAASGTVILKFFLHISKEEQAERLRARETDPMKAWKLSTSDWPEHALYDEYTGAYEDALTRCSTDIAPWYIVPADHKWFRNLAVAHTIVSVLEPYADRWRSETVRRGKANLAAAQSSSGAKSAH
jgi:PPK2 family polyphosphate:nucleotide phosphotransferase